MNDKKSSLKKISGIYKIVNKINGKYYLGSSNNITGTSGRWKEHINTLIANTHDNSYLQRSWNKYGNDNFEFVIVKEIPKSDLLIVEQKYLDEAKKDGKKCYNLSFLAVGGGFSGHKHSEESKRKISEKIKGRPSPNKGKKHPELSGINNPSSDKTIYSFINVKTGEVFNGKRCDFCDKFGLKKGTVGCLTRRRNKIAFNWKLIPV